MSREPQVPVTREGAVGALKLLMIVLAAMIFWQSASAVNAEFQQRGFNTVPPFLMAASTLLVGGPTSGPIQDRITQFWKTNHHLLGLIAAMTGAVLLATRYLIFGRVLDYLYLESPVRDKRVYSGFIANILLVLVHAGIIYGIVFVAGDDHAPLVPVMVMALFGFNMLWSAGIYLTSRPVEREALRGLRYLAITSGAALVLLFIATWWAEAEPSKQQAVRASGMMIASAATALAVCIADAIIQSHIYCRRTRVPAPTV